MEDRAALGLIEPVEDRLFARGLGGLEVRHGTKTRRAGRRGGSSGTARYFRSTRSAQMSSIASVASFDGRVWWFTMMEITKWRPEVAST